MKTKSKIPNMETEKLKIIKWVTGLKDDSAIEKLKLLKERSARPDWWTEISDEEKVLIEKGLDDIASGKLKSHEEAKKIYEKWL